MQNCDFKVTLGRAYFSAVCFPLVSSYFSYKHNCNFVRADACDISSIQSSSYQKMGLRGVTICVVWVSAGMISTAILMLQLFDKEWSHNQFLWQSYCLLCLFAICACYASIFAKICCGARPQHHGAARRQRKPDCNVTHHDYCIITVVATICCSYLYLSYN